MTRKSATLARTLPRCAIAAALLLGAAGLPALADEPLSKQQKPQSGFLDNYDLLQPVKAPEGIRAYQYLKPGFDRSAYSNAVIDPIVIRQAVDDKAITPTVVDQTRVALESSVRYRVSQRLKIVDQPGPGTVRVSIAISGADLETEGFKPRNLLPVSAVLKIAQKATGTDKKTAVLVVESKIVDSDSGEVLRAGLATVSGGEFRDEAEVGRQFQNLARRLVDFAVSKPQ